MLLLLLLLLLISLCEKINLCVCFGERWKNYTLMITLNGGSLGSWVDEERS